MDRAIEYSIHQSTFEFSLFVFKYLPCNAEKTLGIWYAMYDEIKIKKLNNILE